VQHNYFKPQRNVRINCQLPPLNQRSSIPNLKEFRRNTPKRSVNEKESANFIPVLVNQETLVKSGDKKFSVPVTWNKKESSYKASNDLVLRKYYKNNIKHRPTMVGDSHIKGMAANIKPLLEEFEVYDLVKPGCNSNSLVTTISHDIDNLTNKDIQGGSNMTGTICV
jgi:hypothetical protein